MSWFKTTFNLDWTDKNLNPEFAFWVECVASDPYRFRCRLCRKTYSLSNMGRQALISHAKYEKHTKLVANSKKTQLKFFNCSDEQNNGKNKTEVSNENNVIKNEVIEIKNQVSEIKNQVSERKNQVSEIKNEGTETIIEVSETKKEVTEAKNVGSILKFMGKEDVLKSEILWAIKLILSHSTYNSFKDAGEVFKLMFPDSDICKKVTLSSSKMAYLIAFGLSPFFYKELLANIDKNVKFVLCMDEALNNISQKNQMDLIIRYWPESCCEVQVRFLNSVFLGHSTAEDLYEKFIEGSEDLDLSNLLQISIDGPNVNLKFLKTVQNELKENKGHYLIDIGTCSLHVIHNAFQRGNKITKWKLNEILAAIYRIFKNSPARRADFISFTKSDIFPLKFCQVRWVENVKVAERALEVFPNVKKYFNEYKKNLPHNVSIGHIESACDDKLLLSKIAFFSTVASMLEPFLKNFQTSKPMVPFLYDSISDLMRKVMLRFIKRDVVSEAKMPSQLFDINVTLKKNHLRVQEMDIGVGARSFISRSNASELEKTQFLNECNDFFVEMASKIIDKFNVKFGILRSLACINPILLRSNPVLSEKRLNSLLQILHETHNLSALSADCAKQQFITFVDKVQGEFKDKFSTFSESEIRLDAFYHSLLFSKAEYKDLWSVIKMVLTLSHGNASVESGFSINKDILIENLNENSLIAMRRTYDAVKSKGGLRSVVLTSEMLQYAKFSRQRYHQALDERKNREEKELKSITQKRKIQDQIKLLQSKKEKLAKEATVTTQKIDEEISELKKNFNF